MTIQDAKHWHRQAAWTRRSRAQLRKQPLCVMCLERGIITPATVADHVIPHKGDAALYFRGELQSLCMPHHNGTKQQVEKKGYHTEIGLDGFPTDRRHPVYKHGAGGIPRNHGS